MDLNPSEFQLEEERLEQVIIVAQSQLDKAREENNANRNEIIVMQQDMRDNAARNEVNFANSQSFNDLIELSLYVSPILQKTTEYDAVASRIAVLQNIINNPYFARIDFMFSDEDEYEKIYIGRASLQEEGTGDLMVYDWRSPIAGMFYRFGTGAAFYEAPMGTFEGEIGLKRQYEIKYGVLEYYFDADLQIVDDFLRKLLSQNASPRMKSIVETIQRDQDIVIRDMESSLLMVQGVAGSGKTSIALHRAAYLMYQGLSARLAANNIIIISPNPLFESYISHVLPELGEANVLSAVLDEMLSEILNKEKIETKNHFLEKLINDSESHEIIAKSMAFKGSEEFMEVVRKFVGDIPLKFMEYDDVYYDSDLVESKEAVRARVLSANRGVPLGIMLKYIQESILDSAKLIHKELDDEVSYVKTIRRIRELTELSAEGLYRELFSEKQYFLALADGNQDDLAEIFDYTKNGLESSYLRFDDASAMAYLKLMLYGSDVEEYINIKQAVIDEAQDYYPIHYGIFKLLFPGAKYTVLGDINQALGKHESLSFYDNVGAILGKAQPSLVIMDKSFRCTNEILMFSSKFASEKFEVQSFNRSGREPQVYAAGDTGELSSMIAKAAEECIKEGHKSVGIVCKSEKNASYIYEALKGQLDVSIVKDETISGLEGIFIIPVYLAKGLEFDAVLLCDASIDNYSSEEDRKLLYISCTRALHRLDVFYEGEASSLLELEQ
ncbi:MAG: UvrD-helicase domain-containing protein [Eubacteriaceae bacterium]|nr:UvrD-helicase domain-containing protein [Eubacteriaceae bacterium]